MDLSPVVTTYAGFDDNSWLGSAHGTDMTETATLDLTSFADADLVDGYLRPGWPIAFNTNTNKFVKYVDGGSNNTGKIYGFLYGTTQVRSRDNVGNVGVALLVHGCVIAARILAITGVTIDVTDLPPLIKSR